MAAAPLAFSPQPEGWQSFLRTHSFIVLPIELIAILLLMRSGGSVLEGWKTLPLFTKCAILALLVISICISYQPSKDHLAATIGLSRLLMAGMLAMALLGRDGFDNRHWRIFWLALGLGALAYFGLFAVYVTVNTLETSQWVSPFPGFNNIRHIAFLGLIAFSGGMSNLLLFPGKPIIVLRRVLMVAIGTAGVAFVLWTGSRGPLLAIAIVTFGCIILFPKNRQTTLTYAALCFGFGIVIASLLPIPNPIYGILQAFGIADVEAENLNRASSGRIEIWLYTLDEAMKRPFFGWGLNQYAHLLPAGREQLYHPHNYPLQLLFASGFVGAFLVLAGTALLVWQRMKLIPSDAQKFNAIIVATLLVYSLYDGILYFSYPIMVFVLVFIGSLMPPPDPDRSD